MAILRYIQFYTFTFFYLLVLSTVASVCTVGVIVQVQQFCAATGRSTMLSIEGQAIGAERIKENSTLLTHRPVKHKTIVKNCTNISKNAESSRIDGYHQNILAK